ncbi:MAG: hypothetical protein JW891_08935 [Candidatus Lokiarchaeota archaeon]|nr:hypothetical protein [Candidatus Lokiarchaeota archaeon]
MTDLKLDVIYFEKKGPENTEKTLEIAKKTAELLGINDIVLASTTGTVAEKAKAFFDPSLFNVVIITHAFYFTGPSLRQEFPEEKMLELKNHGFKVHASTHAMSGIERGIRLNKEAWQFVDLYAKILGVQFSQGVKVCIEIAATTCDAGLIPDLNRDIICVGGTGRGADTACLIKPAPTSVFKELRVKAILAKPL